MAAEEHLAPAFVIPAIELTQLNCDSKAKADDR